MDFLLLRIEFRTKGPWPFEVVGLRVIGSRADCYIVARLMRSHCSASQVDSRMHSRRTIDVGAHGKTPSSKSLEPSKVADVWIWYGLISEFSYWSIHFANSSITGLVLHK